MAVRKSVKERLAEHKSGKTSTGNVSTDKTTTGSNTGRTLSTAKSSTRESVRDRLAKHKLEKSIGFDTFESDLASISDTINSIYGGWQDADTMANTKSTVSSMYDRLNNYKTYINNTSSDDLTDFNKSIDGLISGYQSALKDWDILSSKYGSYKDADSYTSETTKLNELYSMSKDDLASYLDGDNPIAYTTYSGQDITWQSLFDEQLHKEMATSKEGADGWSKYLADESAAKEASKKDEEGKNWLEWLGETLGGTSDTTLPGANISQTISDKREDTSYMKPTDEWTEEERNIFGAYYLSDPEKAYEYATKLNNSKNKAKKNEQAQSVTDSATSDFWSGAGHTVGSILTAPMGLADYLNDLTDIAAGRPIVESSVLSPFEYSQTVTSGIGSHLNEEYGTIDDSVPILGGKGLGDVYGLGTSVAQSAASAYALGSVGTLVSYFGQGAAAGVDDALSRGATDEQAALYGGILGAAEGISEHIGADRLLKIGASDTLKELLVNTFKQAGAEGLEEAFSSFAGQVADNFIMQDNSNFEKAVRTYMTNGLSEEEATKKAWLDSFESIAYDALGGFISGGVHAVPQTAMQTVGIHGANSAIGSTIQSNNNADDLRDIASGLNNDAYAKYLELFDSGKISNAKLGKLYGQVAKEVDTNYQTEKSNAVMHTIANRANELGDSRNSGVIASAIQKSMNNQSLSTEERNALKSDTAKTIMQEIERGEISVERSGSFKAAYDTKAKVESVLTPKSAEAVRVQKRVAEMNTGAETVDNESGQKIEVEGMRKDEDGNTVLQTSEGERLVSDVTLSDHAAEIVAMAEGMDNTKADTFVSLYTEGMDVEEYATSFELAFSYGKNGYGTENVLKNKGVLTEEQAVSAYETGMRSATEAKQKQIEEVTAKHFTGITPGTFDDSGIDYNKVNTQQRAAIRFTELISKATGVNVVYFQSEADADGKWTAENGRYDANTNTIYLDVNAGITESNAKDLIVPTLSHELTHWMKDKAPAAYHKISGIAMDILSTDYRYSPDTLVAAEQHRHKRDYGREVSEEYAQDELVARACEDMLANPEKIEKYISQMDEKTAKTFSERLREAFEKIKEWLADLLDAYKSNSEEAKIVRKYADKVNELQDAWFDAFDNAIKANEAKKKPAAAAEERMAASDRVQYSERNEQDSIANIESRLLEQLQEWLQGKMPAKGYFELGTTPAILQKFGAKELPIIMEQGVVWKFTSDYKDHAIALDEVAKLPSQIAEPVLLFKGSVPNSFVILTELEDKQGREVIAALHLDKVQDRIRVNRVASIYGKDNVAKYVTTQIENENLLYADKKRSEIWFTSRGLQLPKLVQTLISTSKGSISQTGKNATENSQFSDRAITPLTEEDYSELKEFFGTTTNPKFAGYLLKDGAMLDFSGRHWGNPRPTMREVDHRDVWDVWENMDRDGTDEMVNIIGNGNIRLMPENGGINLAVKPTAEQTETLKKYIDYFRGKIVVDFDEVGKDTVETYTYDRGTDPQRILDDINNYFKGGYRSELAQFRSQFSDRDSEGTGLTKAQIEFFKNSKLRDENGNLKVMYHGTENASFTVFNPEYSDDGISLFFTDSKTVAKGYSGTMEEYIPGRKYTVEELTEIIHDSYYFVTEEDGQYHIIHNNYGELEREHTTDTLEEMQEYVLEEYGSTGAGNYKVYLNIENPYIMDANHKAWDDLAEVNPKTMTQYEYIYATKGADGTYTVEWLDTNNQYGESETEYDMSVSDIEKKFGSYISNQIASGNSDLSNVVVDKKTHEMIPNNTRQLAEYAKENGYDGVIINNLVDTAIYAAGSEKFESATVAIAFNSEQVKSVANENPTKDADMRYSDRDSNGTGLTKEQIEYFKDSKVRDEEGNLLVMYHGTPNQGFTVFRKGSYFTNDLEYAELYKAQGTKRTAEKPGVYTVYLNIEKPFDLADSEAQDVYKEFVREGLSTYINPSTPDSEIDDIIAENGLDWNEADDLTEFLQDNDYDYDGIKFKEREGIYSYMTFSENQIKEVSNTTPTEDEDIRYSDRNTESIYDAVGELNRLRKENEKLKKDVERLRQRNKLERSVTGGAVLNENQIDSVAAYLLRNADSAYSKEQLTAELKEIYKYLQSEDVTWDTLMLKATDAASRIVAEKRERTVPNDYAKEILYVLRNTKVSLNEVQKAEAKYAYGKDWYKMYFGRVLVTNDGIPLDSMWQEWSQMYPDVFDADMTDADMATAVLDAYDAVKASSEIVEAYDRAEMEREIAVEIYNQFWNVSPVRTLADKYERELANVKHEKNKALYEKKLALAQKYDTAVKQLKYEHRVEMKDMKAKYNQRKTEAVYQTKERYQKTIKELRTKRAEEIRQIREKSREYNKAYRDRLARKAEIDKITKKALKLNTWLMKNSKEAHVPEILKKPVAAVLKSLNFSSERLLGMRGGEQAGEPTKKDISLSKAFEDLATVVANINDAQVNDKDITEMYGYVDLPADFVDFVRETSVSINDLLRAVGDNEYILNEMSLDQLKDMNKIISTLSHSVTQLDKALAASHGKSIANLAQGTMQYTEEMGKHSRMVGKVTDFFNFDNALPYYAFKMFGEGGQRIFEAFQDGWDRFAFNVKQIMDYSDNAYTGKEVQDWSKEVHEFEIVNGTERVNVRMTTAQIMSLYCLQKREQAKGHLKGGGIRVADFKEGRGTVSQPDGVTLQENDINTIISTLTDRQIKVADRLQEFMNTVCTDWGNDVSMVRFGYKAFGEENYFPITSDANNLPQDDAKEKQNSLFRLLNMSFTKGTIQNANNRVVIDNIFDVFAGHTSDMAKYNALALPVLDAFKWYNYKEKIKVNPADKDDKRFKTKSLKQHIEKSYGAGAKSYIVQFLRDINGAESGGITNGEQFAKKMMSHYKTAAVGANLRVAILQPTSYIRASVLIDPKYLTKGLAKKPQIEKAKKTCGIALWKSLGFYDTNISKGVAEQIKHDDSAIDKVKEGSMKLAELGDSMTWGYLYNACEAEVSDKHPGLSGKEKEEAVAKRLREVIYATQVVDSTMTRTQMMRNRSSLNQMITSFMSEPMVSYNLLHDCYIQYNADKRRTGSKGTALKRNGKKILRASTAYVFTTLVAAAAGALPDTLRDDEEEKSLETYFANVGENALSDVLGMIPLLKDVFSVMQGYSATRMDEQYIASVWSAYKNVMKSVEEGELTYKTFYSIMKAISQVTGIPVSNLMRDVVAIWNSTIGENYESVNLK